MKVISINRKLINKTKDHDTVRPALWAKWEDMARRRAEKKYAAGPPNGVRKG